MTRLGRIIRATLIVAVLLCIAAGLTLTQSAPQVAEPKPADAVKVEAGRSALLQLRASAVPDTQSVTVMIDPAERDGLVALANQAFRPVRMAARQQGDELTMSLSKPLPLGRWLNVSADMTGESKGFPPVRLTVGHLALSPGWSRWVIDRAFAHQAALTPPDRFIERLAITPEQISVTLMRPSSETGLAGLSALAGGHATPPDAGLISRTYCRLTKAQKAGPSDQFSTHVRRAFADPAAADIEDQNRAALVALAMLAVDSSINELAGDAQAAVEKCRIASPALMLWGRADLSQHWALSAGLAAWLGPHMAGQMGEWKELLDSLPDGTGFSFVDLAADRSGFRHASAAATDQTAIASRNRLATARDQDLLPPALLRGPEGMSREHWEARYANTDAARYQAAVAAIDRQLSQAGIR